MMEEMTGLEIEREVARLTASAEGPWPMVVFTGGEPTLQLAEDDELCAGMFRAVETNGLLPVPRWIDWTTISPKTKLPAVALLRASELKFIIGSMPEDYMSFAEKVTRGRAFLYVQPMADERGKFDPAPALDFIKRRPAFRLSLQFHKLFNIP